MNNSFNYFDVTKATKYPNGEEIYFSDIGFKESFNKYKGFHTFGKLNNQKLIIDFLSFLGLENDVNFIKDIVSFSPQVRKIIKDTKKELLYIIDSPDFLISYIYLLIGFSFGKNSNKSKDSINTINSLAGSIIQIIDDKDYIESNSFFCAHRENKDIKKYSLVKNINSTEFIRVKNLVHGILSNSPNIKTFKSNFYNISGTINGANSVFPNIFLNYLKDGKIFQLINELDLHLSQLSFYNSESIGIYDVEDFSIKVNNFLYERYGDDFLNMDEEKLKFLSREDELAKVALNETLPNIYRIKDSLDKIHKEGNNVSELIEINLSKAKNNEEKEKIKEVLDMFFQVNNIYSKSLYETAFYYLWGKESFNKNSIAFGFDRDHEYYQSLSFEKGFGNKLYPLIYGKRSGKKSENNINNISFRQFWHYE